MFVAEEEEIEAEETISAQIPDWSRERPTATPCPPI
jgi:hypothetical protein